MGNGKVLNSIGEYNYMEIKKCTLKDASNLALLNKQLIEDEKSSNAMSIEQLTERMITFLQTEYDAYYFIVKNNIIGYALVKNACEPLYLRQFLIDRKYRKNHYGTEAFNLLLEYLKVKCIDLEVLPWNEVGYAFWENCGFKEISRYMRLEK